MTSLAVRLLLFDLDDTLVDFRGYWDAAIRETMRLHPSTRSLDLAALFHRFTHYSDLLWPSYIHQELTLGSYRRLRYRRAMADFGVHVDDATADDFHRSFFLRSNDFIHPNPELTSVLESLRVSYDLGIVTNTSHDAYEKVCRLGLRHLFPQEAVFHSERVGCEKPHPQIYRAALDYFNIPPSEAVFVGDSWESDVLGPMAIGMKAIWINANANESSRVRGPTKNGVEPFAVIRSVLELPEILTTLRD